MALNLSIPDLGQKLQGAIVEAFQWRRGAATLKSWYVHDTYKDEYILSIECNGKIATRSLPKRLSIYKAVNEMIDELWPLELEGSNIGSHQPKEQP